MFTKKGIHLTSRLNHMWVKPEGYDTGVKVFNCVTKSKEPLIVKNKDLVTWYTCGPTVYDSPHIGHASCFLKLDVIQRILKQYFNTNLVTVMNITDVDDKIIARSNALKIEASQLTQKYEKEFWNDMDALRVNKPDFILRVTENMDVIKQFIEKLVKTQKTYQSNDTLYFDVSSYDNYGKLQKLSDDTPETNQFKKSSKDFALWKSAKPNEIFWESPWGEGRPGWHIECSALASYIFGSEIDIHAGGIDLRFPHHENEEAQSCVFHNKTQWVNYWIHTGHLHFKDSEEKMSKSLGNTISVTQMLKDTSPETFRMACLMSHYRKNLEFSAEFMSTACSTLQNYINFIDNCHSYLNGFIKADVNNSVLIQLITDSTSRIQSALADDFNTPLVVKILNEVVFTVNKVLHSSPTSTNDCKSASVIGTLNLVVQTLNNLGLNLKSKESNVSDNNFVEVMNILNEFRQDVRQLGILKKDQRLLELCDNVRNSLKNYNITLKDYGKSSSWSTN